ncbi:M20 family metallopeptidase [Nocardia sp. CDC153]|uniref:M20 metallopeptidase family protein n=1 Tax=Nocardia sp. CDC153 TaxID=3112167 RepID=UPI002DB594C1|nr:M20 family metallopeptidase [Nocardia sp. CDC153]MEC3956564.1 M20 family metallopeptidase [Nocardia sp. CDC153]
MPTFPETHALQQDLVRLRREIHADPEIGLRLPRTRQRVLDALAGLPLEITVGRDLDSITAVLRGGRSGRAVLLRGDMDALPLTERTGLDYAARNGAMHACGHDLHTAMLVGAVRVLCARRAELTGDVIFMFQPGEEGADGAAKMIDAGVLDAAGSKPVAAYAIHVMSARFPHGVFTTRRGPLMAGADLLTVTVEGTGGHGSAPHLAHDPIPAAAAMVGALPGMVSRTADPADMAVLTIGAIHAGSAGNILAARAELQGTLRWHHAPTRDALRKGFERVCHSIADAHGVTADPQVTEYLDVTANDPGEADFAAAVIAELHGPRRYLDLAGPLYTGEDFCRVLERVPGAMVLLGACPPDADPAHAFDNHSPYAVFDDAVLTDGALVYAELAARRLADDIV